MEPTDTVHMESRCFHCPAISGRALFAFSMSVCHFLLLLPRVGLNESGPRRLTGSGIIGGVVLLEELLNFLLEEKCHRVSALRLQKFKPGLFSLPVAWGSRWRALPDLASAISACLPPCFLP